MFVVAYESKKKKVTSFYFQRSVTVIYIYNSHEASVHHFLSSISLAIYVCAQVESTEGDIEKNDKTLESHGGLIPIVNSIVREIKISLRVRL